MDMTQNKLLVKEPETKPPPTPQKLKLLAQNKILATERLLKILEQVEASQVSSTELVIRREYL